MTAGSTAAATPAAATPTGVLVGQFEPGSPEWTQARSGCVTATRIASVLGISSWDSPFSLWHRMRGTIPDEVEETAEMEWGTRHEPAIAAKFQERHPEWVVEGGLGTWMHQDRPQQRCTPDRILTRHGLFEALLEAKTAPHGDDGWGPDGSTQIPVQYEAQVQWQMDVMGLPLTYVAVLIQGYDYREYEIRADTEAQAFMRERAAEFLASLDAGTPPKLDGHDRTYWAMKQLPDGVDTVAVDIGPQLADRYLDAQDAAKAAKEQLNEARCLVLDRLGNSLRAMSLGELIAYRTTKPDGTTRALMPARGKKKESE